MHKQAGTGVGNHQRHKHTINASPPTQANNPTRATNGNPPARPLHMHLTITHITPHPVLPRHQPQIQQHGTHRGRDRDPRSAHTTETEAPGKPPGTRKEAQTQQHWRTGTEQRKQNERNLRCSKPRKQSHRRPYISVSLKQDAWIVNPDI